jgi:hypothetical protein
MAFPKAQFNTILNKVITINPETKKKRANTIGIKGDPQKVSYIFKVFSEISKKRSKKRFP